MNMNKMLAPAAVVLMISLAACFGGSNNSIADDSADKAAIAALEKTVAELQKTVTDAKADTAEKFKTVQLAVAVNGSVSATTSIRTLSVPVDFGPCDDGGIKVGATYKIVNARTVGTDELTQVFKQAATTTCPGVYAEYDVSTGDLHTALRLYYTSINCTGPAYVWEEGGLGFDRQKTAAGAAFISPNTEGEMWVAPGTISQMTQVQSAFIPDSGGCVPDGDLQPMWLAVHTDTETSGVPLTLGADYQLSGL